MRWFFTLDRPYFQRWQKAPSPAFLGKSLSAGEAAPGVLCPVLGSPVRERHGCTKESPGMGHLDDEGGPGV